MPESLSEDAKRKIFEDEDMPEDRYREIIDELEQMAVDRERIRDLGSFLPSRPSRMEDAKALRIKAVRMSSGQSIVSNVRLLIPAAVSLATRIRRTQGRGTQRREQEIQSVDDQLRHCAGARHFFEVEIDDGANANFLTLGIASDRGFEVQYLDASNFFRGETVNGDVVCEQFVELTLVGEKHERVAATFYIVPPDDPINPWITKPLVGRHLLQECEHLLLAEDPRDPIGKTNMGKRVYVFPFNSALSSI